MARWMAVMVLLGALAGGSATVWAADGDQATTREERRQKWFAAVKRHEENLKKMTRERVASDQKHREIEKILAEELQAAATDAERKAARERAAKAHEKVQNDHLRTMNQLRRASTETGL